jgi:hypothetical protein
MADWRELYKTTLLETNPTQLERLMTGKFGSGSVEKDTKEEQPWVEGPLLG